MQRYPYDAAEAAEREPLDHPQNSHYYPSSPQTRSPLPPGYHYEQQQSPYDQEYYNPPPQRGYYQDPYPEQVQQQQQQHHHHPRKQVPPQQQSREPHRYSRDMSPAAQPGMAPAAALGARRNGPVPGSSPPRPPPHRGVDPTYYGGHGNGGNPNANITPGADNFGEAAAGGMAGIAYSVAERNARESGLEASRGPLAGQGQYPQHPQQSHQAYNQPPGQSGGYQSPSPRPPYAGNNLERDSHSSLAPLGAAAVAPGRSSPRVSPNGFGDPYTDDPYQGYSRGMDPHLGVVNPNDIADDGDDGLEYRRPARNSMLSLSHSDRGSSHNVAAGAAAAGGVMGAVAGYAAGRSGNGGNGGNPYGPVEGGASTAYRSNASDYDLGRSGGSSTGYAGGGGGYAAGGAHEKSEWLANEQSSRKKKKLIIIIVVVIAVLAAIGGGVAGGILGSRGGGGSSGGVKGGGQSASDDAKQNGDLSINSQEIKELMNNPDLHKIFPGIDYTPLNTQYPECVHDPPSQNNVTRDVAVLSQMTNTIRLYGTDCNQTQMVLHAIERLELKNTVKVWMGVWQDNNATTNARQLQQMWDILDVYGADQFKGVIVANEILFRQQMQVWTLGNLLAEVRTNLTARGMSLPVATSDLGDKWTAELAAQSDYIMANIHPFFAGVSARDAGDWTWSFWDNNNKPYFKADIEKNIIAEVGWPTQGGTNCGDGTAGATKCPQASVASVEGVNQLMDSWVCEALTNGTNYFWFEAFDEPWKIKFKETNKEWEDHWGLMDVNRKLKPGIKIPDCGGRTV